MIRWRRLFLHDMGRKGGALVLAIFLWSLANNQVSQLDQHTMTIQVVEQATNPRANTLQVVVPPQWVLTSPQPGDPITIYFHGPQEELNDFYAQCAATVEPQLNPRTGAHNMPIDPRNLDWLQLDAALNLLRNVPDGQQPQINLHFEPKMKATLSLESSLLQLEGDAPKGYRAIPREIVFTPNQVILSGPKSKVENMVASINASRDAGLASLEGFLEPVSLAEARQSIHRTVRLVSDVLEQDIEMVPAEVRVIVPVYLEERVTFRPGEPVAHGVAPAGGVWEAEPWAQKEWMASLARPPETDTFDEAFALSKIHFYLDLSLLPEVPQAGDIDLPIQWAIVGVEDEKLRLFYHRNLSVLPVEAADAVVRMKRVQD